MKLNKLFIGAISIIIIVLILFIAIYSSNPNYLEKKTVLNKTRLGSNYKGNVELVESFGNQSSDKKIAFIIGVHPREYPAHTALYETIKSKADALNYSYSVYIINVTDNPMDYEQGRLNGQLLASEFAVPDISSKNYSLVVDIHATIGTDNGNLYEETNFIFVPVDDYGSLNISEKIIKNIPELVYYFPYPQSSPSYVTVPIIQNGTSAIVYETYKHDPRKTILSHMDKLISTIDEINF
ncbi:hypothetical protein [Methanobrevibacter filiformis]|uniref:Uncharacterized protein n=1 Tax=Methanobrevibacter filiformis TaxID=55758 RepID=A0A166CJ31_9EURY|nr:hypothetical protein [Methanobrevibacter filiformis]KZX14747.1 hypothetical protein MBFIL_08100 [Methanobrevibacter filiformis]